MRFDHEGQSLLAMGRVIELDADADPETRDTLSEAAWEALEVQSRGTARCADVVFEKTSFALIDDFVEGQPLSALFRLKSSQRVLFPVDVALRIAVDALEALAALRSDTEDLAPMHLHGGIGPDTLLVGTDGSTRLLNPLVSAAASADHSFQLKPERAIYVAPEQWRDEEADERTDVYAIGCILWEMLANRRLHVTGPSSIKKAVLEGKLPSLGQREREDLNAPLRSAVEGALSLDPFERFESAQTFAEALRNCGVSIAPAKAVAQFVESLAAAHLKSQRAATENSTMAHIADILKKERPAAKQTTKKRRSAGEKPPPQPTKAKLPRKTAANANKTLLGIAPPLAGGGDSARKTSTAPRVLPAPVALAEPVSLSSSPTAASRTSAQSSAAVVQAPRPIAPLPSPPKPEPDRDADDAPTLAPKAGLVTFGKVAPPPPDPRELPSIPADSEEEPTQNWQSKLDPSLLSNLGRNEPTVANDAAHAEEVSQEITQRLTPPTGPVGDPPPTRLVLSPADIATEPPGPDPMQAPTPAVAPAHSPVQGYEPTASPVATLDAMAASSAMTAPNALGSPSQQAAAHPAVDPRSRSWPAVTWFFAGCTVTLAVLLVVLLLRPVAETPAAPDEGAAPPAVAGTTAPEPDPEPAVSAQPTTQAPAAPSASVEPADTAAAPDTSAETAPADSAEALAQEETEAADDEPSPSDSAAPEASSDPPPLDTAATTPAPVAATPKQAPVVRRPKPKKQKKSGSGFIPSDL